ncbi:hypothetical protein [Pedobacter glucosidilyticus]|uniref:hypothetical protein n=1 Tax=Pedobacter glucosidilyticus TaxID=1122941 RepID=UPI0026ECA01D|nr:hypothetical protein [Pedobacter glucosidilyticus]
MELNNLCRRIKEQRIKTLSRWKLLLVVCLHSLFFVPDKAQAQTWDEFFKQKKTQQKYLFQQLVALKVYAGYLKKGYDIAGQGISTVKDLKNGEFSLHQNFISSLKSVKPAIRNSSKVAEIIALQLAMSKSFNGIRNSVSLSTENQQYIHSVRKKVLDECAADLEELLLAITSGKVEMKDDERMKRIDLVYGNMKSKSAFTQSFISEVRLLIAQKANEQQSVDQLKIKL